MTKDHKSVAGRFGGDLRPRLISAAIMAAVAATALIWGGWQFAILVVGVSGAMAFECRTIAYGARLTLADIAFIGACAAAPALVYSGADPMWLAALGAVFVGVAIADGLAGRAPLWPILGGPVVAAATAALVWLRGYDVFGLATCVWLLLIVASADIGGYFAGRLIGGPKLIPRVSPGKTWAGLVGGMALAAVSGGVFSGLTTGTFIHEVAFVSVIAAVVSQGGDITESAYKRRFGVKDSGRLIPGHGGALDRLDGLTAAILITAAFTLVRGKEIFVW